MEIWGEGAHTRIASILSDFTFLCYGLLIMSSKWEQNRNFQNCFSCFWVGETTLQKKKKNQYKNEKKSINQGLVHYVPPGTFLLLKLNQFNKA